MKLILENWRKYLSEGRELEQYTTLISREIVNALKSEEVKDAFSHNKQEHLSFKLTIDEILKDLKYVENVYVNMLEGNGVFAVAKYEFILDATEEQREESDITVDVILPLNYKDSVFSELIPELKDSLRHELESAETYYTNEAETKAHVVGIYKKVKMHGVPAGEALDRELMDIYSTGFHRGYAEEELGPIMEKIREYWRYYMQSRFPHAEMDWEAEDETNT